jgi:cell cycle arrest protein BUB3
VRGKGSFWGGQLNNPLLITSTDVGYATGSVEGRIAVEYFDPSSEMQEKKYAFKCHRQTIDDVDHVWPVNALAFHPMCVVLATSLNYRSVNDETSDRSYNTFASAGGDGTVSIWDHQLKKRLRQYSKYHSSIPSIAFNCDGTKLAVGVSYGWEAGEEGAKTAERPSVYIRTLGDEVKVCGYATLHWHILIGSLQPKGRS